MLFKPKTADNRTEYKQRKQDVLEKDVALLASLGYRQEFKRAFKPLELFGVAFSIIGLLPSIASVLAYSIPNGGGPAMVWGWLVAGTLVIFVSLALGELGSAAPTSGGLYFWTFALAPPRWRKLLCWLVGYANTIGNIAAMASVSWGCASQVMVAASIGSNGAFEATSAQLFGLYTAVVISQAIICSFGTRLIARLQTLYIGLNILLVLIIIIALPIATPPEFRNTPKFTLREFHNSAGWPDGYAFIMSFLAPLWTICGFDSSVHVSEEASNAATAVPLAIIGATVVSMVFGFAINLVLAFCMGTNYDEILASPQPMATIFFNSFGQRPTLAIWAFVVLLQYMMGSSFLLAASRQVFAFGRDQALPLSWWLYRINKRTGTPTNTVWYTACLSILLGLLAFAGAQAIGAVFTLAVVGLYFAYSIPIGARIIWGKRALTTGPLDLGTLSVPISTVAVVFMLFMSVVFLFPATPHSTSANMNYSVVVFGGVIFLSICWYYIPNYGGVYWFTGPVRTIDIPVKDEEDLDVVSHEDKDEAKVEQSTV